MYQLPMHYTQILHYKLNYNQDLSTVPHGCSIISIIHKNPCKVEHLLKCKKSKLKFLEENIGINLLNLGQAKISWPRLIKHKRNDHLDFIRIKSFYSSKDTAEKMKRQATNQEKIFTKQILYKGFVLLSWYQVPLPLSSPCPDTSSSLSPPVGLPQAQFPRGSLSHLLLQAQGVFDSLCNY